MTDQRNTAAQTQPEGKALIGEMQAAGFSETEIGEWAVGERKAMTEAGFADKEIDDWFGAPKSVKQPNWFERSGIAKPGSPVAEKGLWGAMQDMPARFVDYLQNAPSATQQSIDIREKAEAMNRAWEEQTGTKLKPLQHAPGVWDLKMTNPMVTAFAPADMVSRGFSAAARGAAVKAVGVAPASHTTGIAAGIEGQLPTPQMFDDAAIFLTENTNPGPMAEKLRTIYEETGITPMGVLNDASNDPLILQDLLSSNRDLPAKYRDIQKTGIDSVEPVDPAAPVPPKPEPITASKSESTVLGKISIGAKAPGERMSFEKLYTMAIDDLNPIRQEVKAMGGKGAAAADDPYILARLSRGTFGKADQFLEYAPFDFHTYQNVGKPLRKILDPVKEDLNGLRAYVVSKRAIELEARGIKSGIDVAAANEVAAAGSKFEPIRAELAEYQNHLTRYLRDSGVLSDAAYDAMLAANKNYVPFFRVMDENAAGAGKGTTARNPIKAIKGSSRDILDPIESIIKNTYVYLALAERNVVGAKFIEMARKSATPKDFAVKVNPEIRSTTVADTEMAKFLKAHGVDNIPDDLLTVFRAARQPLAKNEIAVFEAGKRNVYQLDHDVAAAFKATDAETANLLIQIVALPAKALRAGSVLSPDFMARNALRDQSSAFVLSGSGYLPVFDMVRGAFSLARRDAEFQSWLKSGGANAALVSMDRQYLQNSMAKLNADTGIADRAWNVVKSPLEFLRVASELIENATRLGEFKRAAGGATDKATIQAGGFAAREVTLDFGRIGAKTRAVNMISAFFNAHVQGLDRTARAFIDRPIGTTAKVGASITLPSVLLYLANRDDPRWQEIPRWQKDLFWIVMTDEHIFRIPKPFELGIVFGSLPERMLEAFEGDNPEAFKDLEKSIFQAFVPNMMPTAAAPVIEQFANRSLFTGGPIIPARLEKLLPEYQYTEYTTETTKALGSMIGAFPGMAERAVRDNDTGLGTLARALTTPVLMENYLRGWSGGLGVYALQIADKGLREAGVVPDPIKPAATLADIPVVKAFVVRYPSASAQSIQDFYDRYAEDKRTWDTIMAKAGEGDAVAAEKAMAFNPRAMVQLDGIRDALTEHSQLIRLIHKNPDLPADEKRQLIDTLYFRMIEVARAGNSALAAIEGGSQ